MSTLMTPHAAASGPVGRFVDRGGRRLYEITGVESMEPFLMTVSGDSDLWMFASSRGTITAGRVQPDHCVFPYETDDRLHTLGGSVGPITMVRFADGRLWQPLHPRPQRGGDDAFVTQVIRRTPTGDRVEFEETDAATGIVFRVEYGLAGEHGIVRSCTLEPPTDGPYTELEILDGYLALMPAGVPLPVQQAMSTLVEGYARSEFVEGDRLAVYTLEARISDVAAAMEMNYANTVYRVGLDDASVTVTDDAVAAFERGESGPEPVPALGRRGAYLCRARLSLEPGASEHWKLVADARLGHAAVADLARRTRAGLITAETIDASLERDRRNLASLLNDADAGQATADNAGYAAHRCNVMFNAMRGGVPLDGYSVDPGRFRAFVGSRHGGVASKHEGMLASLQGGDLTLDTLRDAAGGAGDHQLTRLALEYLPLTFARRHGDPSRPWNRYRIKIRDERGDRIAAYEGNWRDIFQNWEAMSRAYPTLLPGMIAKFVNASTADGYNPYRINERGIDWEKPEPDNEWANIGYWGDHQIVYLHRLLKQCGDMLPDWLAGAADLPVFSFAEVPYRLKSFAEIAADPRRSILFDDELDKAIDDRVSRLGDDGRLLLDGREEPVLVTLTEKLLVPALAKVSSLVPGGGVWMNTQRPEWNDANNALAGFGLSMVTLYQLRGYCEFVAGLLDELGEGLTPLTAVTASWMSELSGVLGGLLADGRSAAGGDDAARWEAIEALGLAAERARERVYSGDLGEASGVPRAQIRSFLLLARDLCDDSIRVAMRSDGLYHSYNTIEIVEGAGSAKSAAVRPLSEMLEGQVSILASGVLGAEESADVLDALASSSLYRDDQRAYMLYPRVELPGYLDRNVIPAAHADRSELLRAAAENPRLCLVERDVDGRVRFHPDLESHEALAERLDVVAKDPAMAGLVADGAAGVHDAFEATFRHAEFMGRSGRMHKYEGLGSIFWHMHAKLVLAAQETLFAAADAGADEGTLDRLRGHYAAVRGGLGARKTPAEFGAVPHEPYSHTPWNRCAQQPGMTGQVKEGILARYGELAVRVASGRIVFDPVAFDPAELLSEPTAIEGTETTVPAGSVGLTVCGVPVTLRFGPADEIRVRKGRDFADIKGSALPTEISRQVFARTGVVTRIEATVKPRFADQAPA